MIELAYKTGRKEVSVREGHRQQLSVGGQNSPPGEQPQPPTCDTGEKTNEKRTVNARTRAATSGCTETDGCAQEQSLSPGASLWIVAVILD